MNRWAEGGVSKGIVNGCLFGFGSIIPENSGVGSNKLSLRAALETSLALGSTSDRLRLKDVFLVTFIPGFVGTTSTSTAQNRILIGSLDATRFI